eukprot:13141419-Heterocapsa_arctica.AAC.1
MRCLRLCEARFSGLAPSRTCSGCQRDDVRGVRQGLPHAVRDLRVRKLLCLGGLPKDACTA